MTVTKDDIGKRVTGDHPFLKNGGLLADWEPADPDVGFFEHLAVVEVTPPDPESPEWAAEKHLGELHGNVFVFPIPANEVRRTNES